ncbi:MAG TPA: hypothetical protein EYG85_08835 [Crocinitomix sp.]|nr:hypothetical protein [Crocinitomix sp.]
MSLNKYVNTYPVYDKKEYQKRLINMQDDLHFNRKKIKKLRKKYSKIKDKHKIMYLVLHKDNFNFYLLVYKYFKIDKRLHVENVIKEIYKYKGDNIYFKSHFAGLPLQKLYQDLGSSKYQSNMNVLLDLVTHEILLKR